MKSVAKSISMGLILAGLLAPSAGFGQTQESPTEPKKLELKVGDKMPQFSKEDFVRGSSWTSSFGGQGLTEYRKQGNSEIKVSYIVCKDKNMPFGFYDSETNSLYLDNNPVDGIIDSVIKNPADRKIFRDAPDCPKNNQVEVEKPLAEKLELKVGDKMPQFFKGEVSERLDWTSDSGVQAFMEYREQGNSKIKVSYIVCKDKNMPFGFYDSETDSLYLDNNPLDGIIDSVIKRDPNSGKGRDVSQDIPNCPE